VINLQRNEKIALKSKQRNGNFPHGNKIRGSFRRATDAENRGLKNLLEDFQQQEKQHDREDEANAPSSVIAPTWTHAVTAVSESEDKYQQDDNQHVISCARPLTSSLSTDLAKHDISKFDNLLLGCRRQRCDCTDVNPDRIAS